MGNQVRQITNKLKELGDSDIAAHSQRFFKSGKGEYGEGDKFLGIRVPTIRQCVKEYRSLSLDDTLMLLRSPFHEARLLALLILVKKYSSEKRMQKKTLSIGLTSATQNSSTIGTWLTFRRNILWGPTFFPETKNRSIGLYVQRACGSGGSALSLPFTSLENRTSQPPWKLPGCCCMIGRI